MDDLKELKRQAKGFKVLYVEDNDALREKASQLLKKLFDTVDVAENGKIALEMFKQKHYQIMLTDIKMPQMDGLELSSRIKKVYPDTKIIVLSAFDDKDYLVKSIESGIFRYLTKPINVSLLTTVLKLAVDELKIGINKKLFHTHLRSIFNYQGSMIMMMHNARPIITNDVLLDFFDVETVEEFRAKYINIGTQFLKHNGFLFQEDGTDYFNILKYNEKKIFHVKMKDKEQNIRHFILKYQNIPEREGHGILSFDDVTELNLLKLFDEKQTTDDLSKQDVKAMMDLLEVIQRNNVKIELHNYYKGLSITNDAIILGFTSKGLIVSTSYQQQKAIQIEQRSYISSEALPYCIESKKVGKIVFENRKVELSGLKFVTSSPEKRKTIRVIPSDKHTISLFISENKFHGDVSIEDISLDAVRLKLNALPAGLEKGALVNLDLVLELDKRPLIINIGATVYTKREIGHSFYVVFIFAQGKKGDLVKYIAQRQMEIIREFKGIQNG